MIVFKYCGRGMDDGKVLEVFVVTFGKADFYCITLQPEIGRRLGILVVCGSGSPFDRG